MRGQRSKQYRKLMQQYGFAFGFREPYQVLIDVGMLEASVVQFKMDLVKILTRTLHGEVKPMITQCTIRHLYNLQTTNSTTQQPQPKLQKPKKSMSFKPSEENSTSPEEAPVTLTSADKTAIITLAKTFEKRRCDHPPDEPPLSTHDCLKSVIDPKDSKTNKHHYVIAVQDATIREWARGVRGVPSIFVRRSVMIMEPMAEVSMNVREGAEREKLRAGVKRKRGEGNDDKPRVEKEKKSTAKNNNADADGLDNEVQEPKRKKTAKGPKQPNPLSAMKPKKRVEDAGSQRKSEEEKSSRKRRRKHKPNEDGVAADVSAAGAVDVADE